LALQVRPSAHQLLGPQQGSPCPPHDTHIELDEQWVCCAVHTPNPMVQQAWPIAPQSPQPPEARHSAALPIWHTAPTGTQWLLLVKVGTQQPPLQRRPSQHGCPSPPQGRHNVLPSIDGTQRVLGALQVPPGQHGCVMPPQVPQLPLEQTPAPQRSPFGRQRPDAQQPPPAQALPLQHGCPGMPHAAHAAAAHNTPAAHIWPSSMH
jgi:hypothetical protein